MNMVSENTIKSVPQNHSNKINNIPKTENIREFNFKNFENHKVKINQKREQSSFNHQRQSSQKYDHNDNNYKFHEEMIYSMSNTNIILDINGKNILENDDRNGQSLFYNEKDIQEDKELLDLFQINKEFENQNLKECKVVQQNNPSLSQSNNNASPSNINNNFKQQKNFFNFKKMDIEMIPEEDEERLKTEYETGRKFYDNHQPEKKQESLSDKVRENHIKKKLMINNNPIKKNLENVISNIQKGESENKNINFIKMNEYDTKNKGLSNKENHIKNMKLDVFVKSITPKGDFNNTDLNQQKALRINYNDLLSINNLNGINNLYPYNYSININPTEKFERKDNSRGENLKKSNSELFDKDNEGKIKTFFKYDKPNLNNKDSEKINKKLNLYHSKSVNFDNVELNLRMDLCQNFDKQRYLKEKEDFKVLMISNNNSDVETNKILVDNKSVINNNKSGKTNKSANSVLNNNKNNNSSYPETIKFENNDKIVFENSFDQISEISIKNNSTLNTNYNMSPDKEKTLNESIAINQNSKDKIMNNHLNQENNDLKSLIDFINKKQIQHNKRLANLRLKDETKGNLSKNSSIHIYYQNNSNNSNSAYSKRNAIINSKNIDSVDTDVSVINQQNDLNNKSKLSIKQIKDRKNKDNNHLNILKISKITINDDISGKEVNMTNKQNTISKNGNSNFSQNEIINGYANNNSIFTNDKSLSSTFQGKVRVKSQISSQTKLNLLDKENYDSFNSNFDCLNNNNKDEEKETNKINESQDVLNNNFDFHELQSEEHEKTNLKFNKGKQNIADFDLISVKFPVFTCESTKNKNNTNLFNGNMNFDKVNKDMKLPLINNSFNKSININNLDQAENKNSVNNTKLNNLNNSIFKDKSFLRNLKNNSSLISNKFDFNIYSNFDEESNDPIEKEKLKSFRSNNLKDLKNNLNNASSHYFEDRNKITSAAHQINEDNIVEKNVIQEREIHSNEGKTKFLNPLVNISNNLNKNNNIFDTSNKLTRSKVNFLSSSYVNDKNSFFLKKDNDSDKKSQPIKLFNMNLNKVIQS